MTGEQEDQDGLPDCCCSRVRILKQERVFDGFFAIDRYLFSKERFDGQMSEPMTRLVFERGDSAAVLPFDPSTGELILVQQFRLPACIHDGPGWLWELVAGTCDDDRTPQEVAQAEALEEAGYRLGPLHPLMTVYASPGGTSERMHLFWSDLRQAERVSSGGGLPSSGEDIRVATCSLDKALAMVQSGAIVDAKTVIALQQLALNREMLS